MMLVSPFAICDDNKSWKTSYFKVKSENLNVLNLERTNERFYLGLFINPEQDRANFDKRIKEKEYNLESGSLGYTVSYQIKF